MTNSTTHFCWKFLQSLNLESNRDDVKELPPKKNNGHVRRFGGSKLDLIGCDIEEEY